MIAQATMSGAEFDALPYEEGRQWELLEGELIEMLSTTLRHQKVVANLLVSLAEYFRTSKDGDVYPDVEFALNSNIRLRPDLAIILGEHWRLLDLDKVPITIPPTIAVEVISPSERTANSIRKVRTYLEHQVQEVWQVFPVHGTVLIYTAALGMAMLSNQDKFGTPLLPGWFMKVSDALATCLDK